MPTFAAIDIGANSVRLKIARLVGKRLQVVHEDREVTRLGETVFRTGLLSSDAMAHTVAVLQRFHKAAQTHGAEHVRVVGTSPLRDARNAPALIDWVWSATGWRIEVISGLEEGRLIHLAVISGTQIRSKRALLLDLGGGSCEVTLSERGEIRQMFSLPLGAVRLTQEFLRRDPPKKKELERLRSFITEEIGRIDKRVRDAKVQMTVATSGTAAALAGAHHHTREPGSLTVPCAGMPALTAQLAKLTAQQRAAIPGIGTRRAEIIVAGAMVYQEVLQRFGLPGFRYSPLGLRDGLLAQMSAEYDQATPFRRYIDSQRVNALAGMAEHYHVDVKFAERVRGLALDLFRGLKAVHQLPPEYEGWLSAAAMLQEIGSFINRSGRRRHTYYIISNSEIFGYTVLQRHIIAAIARFVGKSRPDPEGRPMRPLPMVERQRVQKAVILLRLARALEQSRRAAVARVGLRVESSRVLLTAHPKRAGGADLEMWALQKERNYFREVFGRELVLLLS